ncbi:MAG TPA: hypothetical protein VLT58_08720 [Polyangia bacterium]|nr:hypothetical protein [Polyangia bacterium]
MKKAKTSPEVPPAFQPVVRAFAGKAGVTIGPGWGRGGIVLKRDGKIFAMLVRDQFVAKLPTPRVDELVEGRVGVRFDPRRDGRVMKEWLLVDVGAARQWSSLAREAFAFGAPAR